MKNDLKFIPATKQMLVQYYGDSLPGWTMKAEIAFLGEEMVGVIGVYYRKGSIPVAFSEYKDGLSKKHVARGARHMMEGIKKAGSPLIAFCRCDMSIKLLEKMGFKRVRPSVEGEIMLWHS